MLLVWGSAGGSPQRPHHALLWHSTLPGTQHWRHLPTACAANPASPVQSQVACAPGRNRCPKAFLASWGFQCSTMDGTSCCLQPNGKFCARLERWADAGVPPSWRGGDSATTTGSSGGGGGGAAAASESGGNSSSTVWGQSASKQEEQEKEDSGKPWRKATATYFNAYPACCTDDGADSTECDDFSGCEVRTNQNSGFTMLCKLVHRSSTINWQCEQRTAPSYAQPLTSVTTAVALSPPHPAVGRPVCRRLWQEIPLLGAGAQHRGILRGGEERGGRKGRGWESINCEAGLCLGEPAGVTACLPVGAHMAVVSPVVFCALLHHPNLPTGVGRAVEGQDAAAEERGDRQHAGG